MQILRRTRSNFLLIEKNTGSAVGDGAAGVARAVVEPARLAADGAGRRRHVSALVFVPNHS